MLVFVFHLVAFCISKKCDTYVWGNVWIHKATGDDETRIEYQGCKKGCFFNVTYTEDGAKKCEKCSDITDESLCLDNHATCQWTKKKKCKSTSCPQIAKTRSRDPLDSTVAVGRDRRYKECIEGSVKEQYFNKIYLDDYLANYTNRNASLILAFYSNLCDDRQDSATQKGCRISPSTAKETCEKDARDGYVAGSNPIRSNYDDCYAREQLDIIDKGNDNYVKLKYYTSAESFCKHEQEVKLKDCTTAYEASLKTCFTNNGRPSQVRSHVQTKAARMACHNVYGCMYSEGNQRCSVWAVWAFVVVLVLVIIIVGGGLVALFFVFGKDKLASATTLFSSNP